jgi:hypothetical protein
MALVTLAAVSAPVQAVFGALSAFCDLKTISDTAQRREALVSKRCEVEHVSDAYIELLKNEQVEVRNMNSDSLNVAELLTLKECGLTVQQLGWLIVTNGSFAHYVLKRTADRAESKLIADMIYFNEVWPALELNQYKESLERWSPDQKPWIWNGTVASREDDGLMARASGISTGRMASGTILYSCPDNSLLAGFVTECSGHELPTLTFKFWIDGKEYRPRLTVGEGIAGFLSSLRDAGCMELPEPRLPRSNENTTMDRILRAVAIIDRSRLTREWQVMNLLSEVNKVNPSYESLKRVDRVVLTQRVMSLAEREAESLYARRNADGVSRRMYYSFQEFQDVFLHGSVPRGEYSDEVEYTSLSESESSRPNHRTDRESGSPSSNGIGSDDINTPMAAVQAACNYIEEVGSRAVISELAESVANDNDTAPRRTTVDDMVKADICWSEALERFRSQQCRCAGDLEISVQHLVAGMGKDKNMLSGLIAKKINNRNSGLIKSRGATGYYSPMTRAITIVRKTMGDLAEDAPEEGMRSYVVNCDKANPLRQARTRLIEDVAASFIIHKLAEGDGPESTKSLLKDIERLAEKYDTGSVHVRRLARQVCSRRVTLTISKLAIEADRMTNGCGSIVVIVRIVADLLHQAGAGVVGSSRAPCYGLLCVGAHKVKGAETLINYDEPVGLAGVSFQVEKKGKFSCLREDGEAVAEVTKSVEQVEDGTNLFHIAWKQDYGQMTEYWAEEDRFAEDVRVGRLCEQGGGARPEIDCYERVKD